MSDFLQERRRLLRIVRRLDPGRCCVCGDASRASLGDAKTESHESARHYLRQSLRRSDGSRVACVGAAGAARKRSGCPIALGHLSALRLSRHRQPLNQA